MRLISTIFFICFFINIKAAFEDEVDESLMHPDLSEMTRGFQYVNEDEVNSEYWIKKAKNIIEEKVKQQQNPKKAKNIIFFLGDGMSVHTLTATRAYLKDVSHTLSFEKFPHVGLSKTYCVDAQVADSACSATAYLTGVKNNIDMTGVTAAVKSKECNETFVNEHRVESIAKWAQNAGKSTGVVTTTRITHATPSGIYASIANRNWECDSWIDDVCKGHKIHDIADQLIHGETGKNLNVIFGGGRSLFLDENIRDDEGQFGIRKDKRNLIEEFLEDKKDKKLNAQYIWNRKELLSLNTENIDHVLGLFDADHLPYHGDRLRQFSDKADPSLSEMTKTTLEVLKKNPKGFFVLIEGGRIDHAHHYVKARKALEETEEFAKAVEVAVNMFDKDDETLIVVTSDHAHTMTINGYQNRNADILGLAGELDDDKKSYTTLSYANGEGFYSVFPEGESGSRNLKKDDFADPEYDYPSHVPLIKETHGGDDVAIFAKGPQSHLFVGNYEQSYIPLLMAKIAKIGHYKEN